MIPIYTILYVPATEHATNRNGTNRNGKAVLMSNINGTPMPYAAFKHGTRILLTSIWQWPYRPRPNTPIESNLTHAMT